ncbi:helicase associated domain-containing protein [Streptomyces afghaniensis]|uniref:helicase associated domain-containing protein n=1 Tax=Streptomyces afghaniensis TaxID=66865 RepID=UPI0033B8762C
MPAIGTWEQAHAAASAYRTTFGHLDVPADYTDSDGFALGECLANLRLRHLLDRLPAEHKHALDALGMRWTAPVQTFETMLEHARTWAAMHGDLLVPVKEDIGGHRLGTWLATQRRKANAGRLPAAHRQDLEAIDPYWNTPWPQHWQRKYNRAKTLIAATGWRLSSPAYNHASREDRASMDWIYKQRLKFFGLHEGQQDLLLKLGIPPLPDGVYYDSSYDPDRHAFYAGLGHAAAFLARHGHLDVPRHHREPHRDRDGEQPEAFALGEWIHRCRKHPEALTDEQRRALEALRMVWDPTLRRPKPPPAG